MKLASGIGYLVALLLVACATAQSLDGNDAIGNVTDGGHRHDSGTPSGEGGSTNSGTGGAPSTSSGGADQASGGSAAGGAVDSSGGAGGTTLSAGSGGTAGTSTGGLDGGTGGAMGGGGSTQGAGGSCAAGEKVCAGACVTEVPSNGCSAASCTACPIPAPANGIQLCDAQGQCNFECLSGYQKNGTLCTMGGGGASSGGGSGAGGEPATCGTDMCHRCLGNLIGCCNQRGDHCICVLPNQTSQCGP